MAELTPRSRVVSELAQLRARVKDLFGANTYLAAADKLDPSEFCLDGVPLERRKKAIDAACAEIVSDAAVKKQNLELEWQRLKDERWETNKVQQLEISDFMGGGSVFSYPVRKFNPAESLSRKVSFWRAVNVNFETSETVDQIPFEYRDASVLGSTSVLTSRLRRMQSFLVAQLTESLRDRFNEKFAQGAKRRAQLADQISVHQERLGKIASELKDESVLELGRANIALPLTALEVDEKDLVNPVVFSEEELRQQDADRQRDASRRAKFEGSEMMRALQEMMGGKMKSKRELSPLETEIQREGFFDDPLRPQASWTEDERKSYAEYERKCSELEVVREKYRTDLRQEVLKISEEIRKIVQVWTSELDVLKLQRAASDRDILGLELYVVRLHMMEVTRKSRVDTLEQNLKKRLETAVSERIDVRKSLDERNAAVRDLQADLENMFKQEKADIIAAKTSLQKAGVASTIVGQLMKSFKTTQTGGFECPKEIEDPQVWESFLKSKDARNTLVRETADKMRAVEKMETEISQKQAELKSAEEIEQSLVTAIAELTSVMAYEEFNVPILLGLTSGDNEVPFGAVVTDYSDALLVDVAATVVPRNRRIRELAEIKQTVLNDISAFNKKLKAKEFDLEKLNLQIDDFKETVKDVHLAKVTRDLKTIIKEDPKTANDKQAAVLSEVKAHVAKAGDDKVRQLQRFLEQVEKNIAKKEHENDVIVERIRGLQTTANTVSLSASDTTSSISLDSKTKFKGEKKPVIAGGGKVAEDPEEIKEAQKAFHTVRSKAELLNLVQMHNREIERLRKALDKFRQRTFPSFASNKELGFRRSPADFR